MDGKSSKPLPSPATPSRRHPTRSSGEQSVTTNDKAASTRSYSPGQIEALQRRLRGRRR
jgi:hypothetical protein